jgi:hypothetical protein
MQCFPRLCSLFDATCQHSHFSCSKGTASSPSSCAARAVSLFGCCCDSGADSATNHLTGCNCAACCAAAGTPVAAGAVTAAPVAVGSDRLLMLPRAPDSNCGSARRCSCDCSLLRSMLLPRDGYMLSLIYCLHFCGSQRASNLLMTIISS